MIPDMVAMNVGTGNSVTTPADVIRATRWGNSVNHMLPSAPAVIHCGVCVGVRIVNS